MLSTNNVCARRLWLNDNGFGQICSAGTALHLAMSRIVALNVESLRITWDAAVTRGLEITLWEIAALLFSVLNKKEIVSLSFRVDVHSSWRRSSFAPFDQTFNAERFPFATDWAQITPYKTYGNRLVVLMQQIKMRLRLPTFAAMDTPKRIGISLQTFSVRIWTRNYWILNIIRVEIWKCRAH